MARSFNGTNEQISAGNSSILNPNGAGAVMTLSAWVYGTSFPNTYNSVASHDDGTTVAYQLLVKSTGKLAIFMTDNNGGSFSYDGTGSNTLSTNTWYHLLLQISNSAHFAAYLNGSSDGSSAAQNTGIKAVTANTTIGINNTVGGTARWAGRLADIGIWNVVLTASEITALSNGAIPYTVRPLSLLGYWPLDGLQSPEPDFSGNALNGTLTGTGFAVGPPVMMFTPRWPLNSPIFIPTSSFQPAWAIRTRIVVDGIGI